MAWVPGPSVKTRNGVRGRREHGERDRDDEVEGTKGVPKTDPAFAHLHSQEQHCGKTECDRPGNHVADRGDRRRHLAIEGIG